MKTEKELYEQYKAVPGSLKALKRWICWSKESIGGDIRKVPINPISGGHAKSNEPVTWSTFEVSVKGCVKYNCAGLGFMLGNGITGVDIDNHPDKKTGARPMTDEQFKALCGEFVSQLDSYSEISQSGEGVHIICYASLPEGSRHGANVEMYDTGRFFAFTGNVIRSIDVQRRDAEIISLWKKYVDNTRHASAEEPEGIFVSTGEKGYHFRYVAGDGAAKAPQAGEAPSQPSGAGNGLSDEEIIRRASQSAEGADFMSYYSEGKILHPEGMKDTSHSAADQSFACMLAFWCNKDAAQMDRIFRSSALMRDKWDEMRGRDTYGHIVIANAVRFVSDGYRPGASGKGAPASGGESLSQEQKDSGIIDGIPMNIGPDGEPIFRIKKIFKRYDATDTGNALRFYDYFGGLFRYNVTDKCFMFWTGKTWVRDSKCIIKKYANKLIEIMQAEADDARRDASERMKSDDSSVKEEAKALAGYAEALAKNVCRLSNKAGKDAMIAEFQTLYDIPVESSEFNKDDYLLNTDSGIVSLRTGSVLPFDPSAMLSRNTNTKVSYEEPVTWMKFLRSVFDRGNDADTQQVIDCVQECLGYTLSGSNKQQVMFLLYGDGSNGKSTFSEEVMNIMGDYADAVSSQILMQQKSPNNSVMFTLAKLMFARFVETGETDEGNRLAEATLKNLTGDEYIAAQFKFGNEFKYRPHFKIWMATNSKPVIRGTNLGIWRRIFPFPFLRTFTDQNKDIYLPEKLKAESDRILGWCIRGFQKYYQKGEIEKPACLQREIQDYRDQMDVVAQFLKKQCEISKTSHVNCRVLYKEYKAWAFDNSEFCLKESKFSEEMEKKGYPAARFDGALCYSGVSLMSGPSSYSYSATRFGDE